MIPEQTEGANHDGLSDTDSSDIDSAESVSETPSAITETISSGSLKFQILKMIFLFPSTRSSSENTTIFVYDYGIKLLK